ncbi:hypothetical protein EK21DRAFT_119441 [Setomelanomma holmii]|uniref:Uncharacterized protein n=1 Tax=Setomelanomma holmii TaxID=210430 RepID=A0A9P4GWI4_9PLEO|nr:hypothetical protein EK21DRAFT_119441 [Setomelanomma holmii]
MPSTRPRPFDRPSRGTSAESIRTGIIVSVVVGALAVIVLANILWSRRAQRGVMRGMNVGARHNVNQEPSGTQDKELEIGIIVEPLPVYRKEPPNDEVKLAMTAANDGRLDPIVMRN